MKVKLIRAASTLNPEWSAAEAATAKETGKPYDTPHSLDVEAGTVIDHPDSWKLVRMGYAVPEDEEAQVRCGLNQEQIDAAIAAQNQTLEEFDKRVRKARKKKVEG